MSQDSKMNEGNATTAPAATVVQPLNQQLAVAAAAPTLSPPQSNTKMLTDRQKIMTILGHRQMLLERVKLCRNATETRIALYDKEGTYCPSSLESKQDGEEFFASRKRKFPSKDVELQTFAELSKYAINYTVKKAPVKLAPPAPRNISLRTGSSVGNKMKAAVATLRTNVGWISDTSSSSNSQPANRNVLLPQMAPPPATNSQIKMKNVPCIAPANGAPLHPPGNGQKCAAPSAAIDVATSMAMPVPKPNVKKISLSLPSAGKQLKKKSFQSGKKRSGKSVRSGSSMSTSEAPPTANKPLHLLGSNDTSQAGQREHNGNTRVLCPETDRLRKKRSALVQKLDNLMRRADADTTTKEELSERQISKAQFDDNPYSNGKKTPWKSFVSADSAPCLLPGKKKTQWDYVLEEMRWLATDYIEENKWKRSTARIISSAVMTHHTEAAAKAKTSSSKISKSTPSSERSKFDQPAEDVSVEIKSSRYEESMEEDSDLDSLPDELISTLDFVDPTVDDIKATKSCSSTINEMVKTHWKLYASVEAKVGQNHGYRRLHPNKKVDDDKKSIEASRDKSTEKENGTISQLQQLTFNEIEERLNKCREKAISIKSKMADNFDDFHGDISAALEGTELEIQENQMESLQFTEALWDDENKPQITGSVISGPIGCGKTFSTGLLMWRRKEKGPQLLLCPAASLMRWRHEFRHFGNLNVTIFDAYKCSGKKLRAEMVPATVILCDFAGAAKLLFAIRRIQESFATIIVDSRCSSFPFSSRNDKISTASSANSKKRRRGDVQEKSNIGELVANELYSSDWWNRLIEIAIRKGTRCALVETSCVSDHSSFLDENDASSIEGKDKQGILASKIAFLYHKLFQSKHKTNCRRAFWWAKKLSIAQKKESENSRQNEFDYSHGAKGILLQLINTVSFSQELTPEEAAVLLTNYIPKWTVQMCTLSSTQRKAYDQECLFVRGAFQHEEGTLDGGLNSAKALLRLRRVCFHSDIHQMISHRDVLSLSTNTVTKRKAGRSASQPNIAKAKSLIEGSSKLRQLLSILCKDCGFVVPAKSYLLGTKATRRGRKSSAAKRKKVLVLASLPEVLLLISSFLNALGISHELLTSPPSHTLPSRIDDILSTDYTLSWIQCQQSLARFDHDHCDDSPLPNIKLNVLVSSPNTLASTSLGLGASNAEVVISMDEDWSGSFDLSTFSILRKNLTHNSQKVTGRKYIKVISEDTCEETFLTYEKKIRGKTSSLAVPLSMPSLHQTRVYFRQGVLRSIHPTVGKKLLRFARVPLYKVFCADILRSGTLFGGPLRFLAPACPSFEDTHPCDPPQSWDKVSVLLDDGTPKESPVMISKTDKIIPSFSLAMVEVEQSSILTSVLPLLAHQVLDPYDERLRESESLHNYICHDMCSKDIHKYISSMTFLLLVAESSYRNNGIVPKKGAGGNGKKEKATKKRKNGVSSLPSSDNSLFQAFGNSNPEEIASSLMWYKCLPQEKSQSKAREQDSSISPRIKDHRTNSYVRSYMSVKKQSDGNQGCESLLYFPPLFPGLLESRHSDEGELCRLEQSLMIRDLGLLTETKKRKIQPEVHPGSSKKLRDLPFSTSVTDFSTEVVSVTPSQPLPHIPGDFNLMTVSDVDFMDGTDDLFDGVDGDFLSDLNITKDEEVMSGDVEDAEPDTTAVKDSTTPSLNEDFGILGPGLLPPLEESSRAADKRCGQSNSYSYWLDPFEPLSSSDDPPFKGPSLDSVILYVKKSIVPRGSSLKSQPLTTLVSSKPLPGSPAKGALNGGVHSQILKKKKKGLSSIGALTAFVAPSTDATNTIGSLQSTPSGLMSKIPSSRPLRDSSTVFDLGSHRGEPSLQVHHHLQNICDPSRDPMSGSGIQSLGKPISMVSTQSSIRELLPGESTGDAAKLRAKEQSLSFWSEDLVTDGVYFGPFSTSILPKASVRNDEISIKKKDGIRLPMGVKVPKSMGVVTSKSDEWSLTEDQILKQCATRFYRNWYAVSQALTHKSRISSCQDTANVMNPIRSAKHCKNRWDKLIELASAAGQAKEEDNVEVEEETEKSPNTFTEQICNGILLDPRSLKDANDVRSINSVGTRRVLHRSKKLNNARTKIHFVPLTIPGYTPGTNMPPLQIVSSHLSHSQSVQDAIAVSARPSGIVPPRAEMWPLQFLDLTEKQQLEVEKKKKAASGGQPQVHTSQQGTAMRSAQLVSRQTTPNPAPQRFPARPPTSSHMAVSGGQRQPTPAIPRVAQQPVQTTTYSRPMPTGPPHNPPSKTNSNR